MKTIQKIGLGLGATALALGGLAGFAGLAQAADPVADPAPATPAGPANVQGWGKGDRQMGGQMAADLAAKLGVDQAEVAEALTTAHEALREAHQADATTRPTLEERRADLARELAKALGIDEAKVTEALASLDADRAAARSTALQERLDQAVTDGKLTRTEADAVKKAVENGVLGGMGKGGMGKGMGMWRGGR